MPYSGHYVVALLFWLLSSLFIAASAGDGATFGSLSAASISFIGGHYAEYGLPAEIELFVPVYWVLGLLCLLFARVGLIAGWFVVLVGYQLAICVLVGDALLWSTVVMFLIPQEVLFAGLFGYLIRKRATSPDPDITGSLQGTPE